MLAVLSLLLTACTPDAPPAPAVAPPAAPPPAPVATRADAANAKLPADAGGLRFEERAVVDPTEQLSARGVVPVGWAPESGFAGWFAPAKDAGLGWMTSYKIGTTCKGTCEPKDWKAIIDEQMLANVPDTSLLHDETLPGNGRIRWGADPTSGRVYAAWYQDGAPRYHECSVNLDSAAMVKAIDAFVEACKATVFDPA